MNFVSCFSGIEAASAAWEPLGWKCLGVSEIDPSACMVLKHRLPDVPNLGDVLSDDFLERIAALKPDVLVGGPPCQDFSVAGLRAGIHGHRGNLTLRWVQVIHAARSSFSVTENVPGWLSSDRGHAFGAFLAGLVGAETALIPPKQCGGQWTSAGMVDGPRGRAAWRILDAQYFGVAQRRRRVFVIFCPRGGFDPAEILFERQSLSGNPPPRREAGQGITGTLSARTDGGGGLGTDFECTGGLIPQVAHTLSAEGFDASEDGSGRATPLIGAYRMTAFGEYDDDGSASTMKARDYKDATDLIAFDCRGTQVENRSDGLSPTLRAMGHATSHANGGGQVAVALPIHDKATRHQGAGDGRNDDGASNGLGIGKDGDPAPTLDTSSRHAVAFAQNQREEVRMMDVAGALAAQPGMKQQTYLQQGMHVRRITPRECERLQGFPDNWTLVPAGKGMTSDAARYKMIGNSMAVPVMAKIGQRIDMVKKLRGTK